MKPALPTLERLLHLNDEEVLSDACAAVWYMSYGSEDGIQSVIEAGFVPILVQLLQLVLLIYIYNFSSFATCLDNEG